MSKQIKVGDIVRIFDGVGRGQKQVVRDLVDLPMGTGIVVMLDHGELETLNPANVEVFSADGVDSEDEDGSVCEVCGRGTLYGSRHHACGDYALRMERRIAELEADREEPSVFMPNADLIRRIKALEIYVSNLEAHLRGHEKYAHEKIGKHIADLTKSQKFVREYLDEHVDEYLADLNSGQRRIRNEIDALRKWAHRRFEEMTPNEPADETTENIATRTHWRDPESLLGRLHPSAWLKVSQNDERGDFVAVIHMVHPPDESTYHYGRGKTRADAVRAAHDGFERVIAMNKARDEGQ